MANLSEELNPNLQELYKVLDGYCQENNIGYSVDCDEANEQGYLVRKSPKVSQLIDHMRQVMGPLNQQVVMTINPQPSTPLNVGPLPPVRKDGTLLHFAVKTLQDSVSSNEDKINSPTRKYLRSQAPYRSSFGKAKSFGGITSYAESKTMLGNLDPFTERLDQSINEHVEITFTNPDVLLTHQQQLIDGDPASKKEELIKNAISLESKICKQYIEMMESTEDEEFLVVLESLTEKSNENIKKLEALLSTANSEPVAQPNQVKN